jgi:hypothetical protein
MNYQWDPKKAASNLNKHGVDFADAVGVFEDEWALTLKGWTFWGVCWWWSTRIGVKRFV